MSDVVGQQLANVSGRRPRAGGLRGQESLLAVMGYGVGILSLTALLPLLVGQLGLVRYGAWAVTGGVVSYVAVFDLGFGLALVRFVGLSAEDDRRARAATAAGTACLTGFALIVCGVSLAVASVWESHLGVADSGFALMSAGVALLFVLPTKAALGSLEGYGRVGLSRLIQAGGSVSFMAGAVLAATGDRPLRAMGLYLVVHSAVTALLTWLLLSRELEGRTPLVVPSWEDVRMVSGYAFAAQAGAVMSVIADPVVRVVVAATAGPAALVPLDVALRVRAQWFGVGQAFLRPLLPALGRGSARSTNREMPGLSRNFATAATVFAAAAAGIALLAFPSLFGRAGAAAGALSAAAVLLWLPMMWASVPYAYLVMRGSVRDLLRVQFLVSGMIGCAGVAGALAWGAWGAVIGAGVGAALGSIFVELAAGRIVGRTAHRWYGLVSVGVAALAIGTLAETAPRFCGLALLAGALVGAAHGRSSLAALGKASSRW